MSVNVFRRSAVHLALLGAMGVSLSGCMDESVEEEVNRWQGGEGSAVISIPLSEVAFNGGNALSFDVGVGSGAYHRPGDPANVFYALTDRGPNIKCKDSLDVIGVADFCGVGNSGDKIFPLPDFTPAIYKFELSSDFVATVLEVIPLKGRSGVISGITNPFVATDTEKAFDNTGAPLAFDPSGLDTESITGLADGSFWISDEYGPSLVHVAADGTIMERVVPQSVAADLAGADYPVTGGLPDILKKRKLNRGIESVTISPDEKFLYFVMQSPLANPDKSAYSASRHVRLMKYTLLMDGSLGDAVGEYVYELDTPQSFADIHSGSGDLKNGEFRKQSNVKVSEMVAIDEDDLIVLERVSKVTKLYRVSLDTGDNLLDAAVSNLAVANNEFAVDKTLEQMYDLASVSAMPLKKSLAFDSMTDLADGISLPKKIEGIALLDEDYVLLINDNDFAIEGDSTVATVLKIRKRLSSDETRSQRIKLVQSSTYASGIYDQSAAEINAYSTLTKEVFVTNAATGKVDILNVQTPGELPKVGELNLPADINDPLLGMVNSVAVHGSLLAVSVERGDGLGNSKQGRGVVAFYNVSSRTFLKAVEVGFLPDMIIFTPDGKKLLVANEAEPNDNYTVDPQGSVSIINIVSGVAADTAIDLSFVDFNTGAARAAELPAAVRVFGPAATVAQDLEPEYIAVSKDSRTAWVALQENNALAIVDLDAARISSIAALGFKDHSKVGNALDASDRDNVAELDGTELRNGRGKINVRNWDNVLGMYQPDSIASYTIDDANYVVTANEGDSRDYAGFSEEVRLADVVADGYMLSTALDAEQSAENLGRLKFTNTLGESAGVWETLYAYGTRSFSIRDELGRLVFDSGDEIERITAGRLGQDFNASNSKAPTSKKNDRSGSKGPEPEALTIGVIDERSYAFIGLERVGGIMVYDITHPRSPQFVQYLNNRDFSKDPSLEAAGDSGPEGMSFVSAEKSPSGKPMLIVSSEVSGTTTVYEID